MGVSTCSSHCEQVAIAAGKIYAALPRPTGGQANARNGESSFRGAFKIEA